VITYQVNTNGIMNTSFKCKLQLCPHAISASNEVIIPCFHPSNIKEKKKRHKIVLDCCIQVANKKVTTWCIPTANRAKRHNYTC
jgi:hypothetical protein